MMWRLTIGLGIALVLKIMCCAAQTAVVQVLPWSVNSGSFEVARGSDRVVAQSRELEVAIKLSSNQIVTRYVSMLYDPATKLFWWNSDSVEAAETRKKLGQQTLLPQDSIMCLTPSKFVLFWNGWSSAAGIIFIRESSEHYSSLNEGQNQVLRELEHRRPDIEARKFIHIYKEVHLPGLDRDFLLKKYDANGIGPTLGSVTQAGNEWHVVEDGPNGGTATVVLNDKYEVVSVKVDSAR